MFAYLWNEYLKMEIIIIITWIGFFFCLGLTAGGILMLFRKKEANNLSAFKFLQYSVILLYTFGFYSLWSRIFFQLFFNLSPKNNLQQLSDFVGLIGTPFLLGGLIMFFFWIYHLLKEPPGKTFLMALFMFVLAGLMLIVQLKGTLGFSTNRRTANLCIAGVSLYGNKHRFTAVIRIEFHRGKHQAQHHFLHKPLWSDSFACSTMAYK